jgi:alkylhydroperoxidase family enzyme
MQLSSSLCGIVAISTPIFAHYDTTKGPVVAAARGALAWTEAVTLVSVNDVTDDGNGLARQQLTEKALVDLTLTIVVSNG